MDTIPGVFENGLIRPLAPLDLPNATPVDIVVPVVPADDGTTVPNVSAEGMEATYEILNRRYNSGSSRYGRSTQ